MFILKGEQIGQELVVNDPHEYKSASVRVGACDYHAAQYVELSQSQLEKLVVNLSQRLIDSYGEHGMTTFRTIVDPQLWALGQGPKR